MEVMKKLIEDCVKEEGKHEEIRKWEIYEQVEGYKRQCTITAYEEFSIVSRIKNKHTLIYNKDIIGAEIKDEENDSCKIEISAMPIIDFKEKIRELYTYTYWVNSIKKAKDIVGTFIDISLGNPILDEYKDLPPKTKHLLILINPFSCSGQAVKNWNVVYPMISKFHLNFKVLTTEYSGHAKEICANENISLFTSIVTVSGDGLIHEVVNGLMQRKDKLEPLPLVGVLPGGTSDGLVKTILFECGEGFSLTNAVYVVGKGKEKKIDLFKIKAEQNDTLIYSFLGLSWAICSDIDLESEVIRFCGNLRYYIWALWRIISLRHYGLTFKVKDEEGTETVFKNYEIVWLFIFNLPYPDKKVHIMPISRITDGLGYMTIMDSNMSRKSMLKTLLAMEDGPLFKKIESEDQDVEPIYEEDHENFYYDLYKGKEFSIEPDDELIQRVRDPNNNIHYGRFSIDGEPYPIDKYN